MTNLQQDSLPQDQEPQAVQGSNATILYDTPEEELVEDSEVPEITEESDELPLPEDDEDPTEKSADFASQFKEHFGLPVEEAQEILQELIQEREQRQVLDQKYELAAKWEVPIAEVDRRMALVTERWSRMSPEDKAKYDSVQGAIAIYKSLQPKDKGIQSSFKKSPATTSKYDFTQRQIDSMSPQERQRLDAQILRAYAAGRVQGAKR